MLYTIGGALIGGVSTYIICKVMNEEIGTSHIVPTRGDLLIIFATILGAGIGFGIGVSKLANGNYL